MHVRRALHLPRKTMKDQIRSSIAAGYLYQNPNQVVNRDILPFRQLGLFVFLDHIHKHHANRDALFQAVVIPHSAGRHCF
jgi:hypothetical protein